MDYGSETNLFQRPETSMGCYSTGCTMVVLPKDFMAVANEVKEIYTNHRKNKDLLIETTAFLNVLCAAVSRKPFYQLSTPSLSSIGNIDTKLHGGAATIHHLWWGSEIATGEIQVFLWAWRGNIWMSALYCENYYEKKYVKYFPQTVKTVLFSGLGIEQA